MPPYFFFNSNWKTAFSLFIYFFFNLQKTVCKKINRQTIPKSCDKIETEECRQGISAEKVCFKSGCSKKTICEPVAPVEKCVTEYIEKCDYVPTYSMGHKKGFKSKGM